MMRTVSNLRAAGIEQAIPGSRHRAGGLRAAGIEQAASGQQA